MVETGNTSPEINQIIECNEVSEGQVMRGHDMVFQKEVFGEIFSDGGTVQLENSLGWGSIINPGGVIQSNQRAFNATLQAPGGVVEMRSAENCLIIAREARIQTAVKCQIFAHTLRIATATGCLIAGRNVEIHHAKPYKVEPNIITMVIPDIPDPQQLLDPLIAEACKLKVLLDSLNTRINAYKENVALSNYLSIRAKVRVGMLELTADQSKSYIQMEENLEATAKELETQVAERNSVAKTLATANAQIQEIHDRHSALIADCRCKIHHVDGESIVRQLLEPYDGTDLSQIALPSIPKILFRNDASLKFLGAVVRGTVDWHVGEVFTHNTNA